VQYFGTFKDTGGNAFLVTELMFKGDLKTLVREQKSSLNFVDLLAM
jgi:hypothetical protein